MVGTALVYRNVFKNLTLNLLNYLLKVLAYFNFLFLYNLRVFLRFMRGEVKKTAHIVNARKIILLIKEYYHGVGTPST